MRHLFPQQLSLLTLLLLALVGCGDSPSEPQTSAFNFGGVFTEEEAVVTGAAPETRLRMIGLQFATSTATLTPASLTILDKFAPVFEKHPGMTYTIEGHTDSAGAHQYNLDLSQRRAEAVRAYLVNEVGGLEASISAVGYGEDRPIANNATANGRAENRRIEIVARDASGARVFDLSILAYRLEVQEDCDSFTSSASAAAGDFYIRVELRRVRDGVMTVIDGTANTLIRANDGEIMTLNIGASGSFIALPGAHVEAIVSIYENDTDRRQFHVTATMTLVYDPAAGCWKYAGDDTCLGSSGNITAGVMRVRDSSGDPCSVDLFWRFGAEVQ